MQARDIIVVGTSAGGVEALQQLVRQLPPDFRASMFVVVHVPASSASWLPDILSRAGQLPAEHAYDGAPVEPGRIYVAPPDQHLVLERDHVHLSMGPKEQHHRPCINVTFRSAALAYGPRVAGVVLTGELDDGTAGLWEIKRRGGIAVVQNPEEAMFPSMPLSALREIDADHTVSIADMGSLLTRLAAAEGGERRTESPGMEMEPKLTDLTCPDCRGTIWELSRGNGKEYRCRVGHAYSAKSMIAEHLATQEKALYAALVALEEGASLATRLSHEFNGPQKERFREEARRCEEKAEQVRQILPERRSFSLD